jgi:hypothetical protein
MCVPTKIGFFFWGFEVTNPPPQFSCGGMVVVEFVLRKSVRFSRYERFGVFGLNGHFGTIGVFF